MRFELYRDASGHWRWRLRTQNGNVVADSGEGYARREDCEHGIEIVKGSAAAATVDMTTKIA
ncbi:YegP family protein [Methylobacterium sp. A54F]